MSLLPLVQDGTVEVEWTGWKMPEGIQPPAPKPEGYGAAAKKAMSTLLEDRGLTFNPPSIRPDMKLAHIGTKIAASEGKQLEYVKKLFHAHWVLNDDLSNSEVLVRAAQEIGLDADRFSEALSAPEWSNAVEGDYDLIKRLEISTIPSYVGEHGTIQVHHFEDMPSVEELREIL